MHVLRDPSSYIKVATRVCPPFGFSFQPEQTPDNHNTSTMTMLTRRVKLQHHWTRTICLKDPRGEKEDVHVPISLKGFYLRVDWKHN